MANSKKDLEETPAVGKELFGGFGSLKAVDSYEAISKEELPMDPEVIDELARQFTDLIDNPDEELAEEDFEEIQLESGYPGHIPPGSYRLRERCSLIPLVDGPTGETWRETILLKSFGALEVEHRANLRREVEDYTRDESWCIVEVEGLPALARIDDLSPIVDQEDVK